MSDLMFTSLPVTSSAQLTDIICAVQGYSSPSNLGTSVQETLGQILDLFQNSLITRFTGNPNSNIAGNLNDLCWDTVDQLLYICTVAGSATTAVWTPCIGQPTSNQILIGTGAVSAPELVTVTAGANMSIVNSSGTLTFSSTGGSSLPYVNVTSTTQTLSGNSGFQANNASLVTFTLPTVCSFGQLIYINGFGAGGWTIQQNSGQNIQVGDASTTIGNTGSLSSTNRYDSIVLLCAVANTTFVSLGAPQGNLTIV